MEIEEYKEKVLPTRDKLYRYAYFLLKNEEDAKDVVQDVLLKIWDDRHKRKFDNIEAWAITLIKNMAMDKLRRKKKNYSKEQDLLTLTDRAPTPDQRHATNHMYAHLQDQIQQLSEKQQNIFHLREIEGRSYQEISEALDLDISQVKVYLHRARKFLKDKLFKIESYGLH